MISYIHKTKKLFSFFFLISLSFISFFVPKKNNLWVFGAWSGKKYADNSRYLFEYILKKRPDIKAIWLTDSDQVFSRLSTKGCDVRYKKSFSGYFSVMRSTYQIICCDFSDVFLCGYPLAKSKVIQLWHGIPIKKVLMSDEAIVNIHTGFYYRLKTFFFPGKKLFFHTAFAPSNYIYHLYSRETFKGLTKNLLKIGQPRNDLLIESLKQNHQTKKILYAPTYRHNKIGHDQGSAAYETIFPSAKELSELEKICGKYGYEFIIRLHPLSEGYIELLKLEHYQHIKQSIFEDINQDLIETSILITDISSSIFDYALLDRTLLICFPDLTSYQANSRDLYFTPDLLIDDNFIFYKWGDCVKCLSNMLASGDFPQNMKSIAEKYNSYSLEGKSCQKIVDFLTEGHQLT